MATFNKYNCFVENIAEKVHNLASDTLKVALTNTAPAATDTAFTAGSTDLATGNGYTAGGNTASVSTSSQTAGTYKLVLNDPTTWTASGGSIGPFRYAILYNSTAASGFQLIGWWDYGSSVTLASGETFFVDLDQVNGVLTIA